MAFTFEVDGIRRTICEPGVALGSYERPVLVDVLPRYFDLEQLATKPTRQTFDGMKDVADERFHHIASHNPQRPLTPKRMPRQHKPQVDVPHLFEYQVNAALRHPGLVLTDGVRCLGYGKIQGILSALCIFDDSNEYAWVPVWPNP